MSSPVRASEIKPLPSLERGAARVSPVLKALIIRRFMDAIQI